MAAVRLSTPPPAAAVTKTETTAKSDPSTFSVRSITATEMNSEESVPKKPESEKPKVVPESPTLPTGPKTGKLLTGKEFEKISAAKPEKSAATKETKKVPAESTGSKTGRLLAWEESGKVSITKPEVSATAKKLKKVPAEADPGKLATGVEPGKVPFESTPSEQPEQLSRFPNLVTRPVILARTTLFMLLLELFLSSAALVIILYSSWRFSTYSKILPNFMHRYGLFLGIFISNIFTTFIIVTGAVRIHKFCFDEAFSSTTKSSSLRLLQCELVTSGTASVVCGFILLLLCGSWYEPIRTNMLYAVKHALSDNDYAQEINVIQQRFHCCGVSVNGTEPHLVWLYYLQADTAFREDLYNEMASLPWSCCRSGYQSMRCEQFAYQRFVVPLNETNFERIPSYAARFKRNWDCTTLNECKQTQALALNSLYNSDCADVFYQAFKAGFFYLNGAVSIALGSLSISVATIISYIQKLVKVIPVEEMF